MASTVATPAYQKIAKRTARYLLAYIKAQQEEARREFREYSAGEGPFDYDNRINSLVLHGLIGKLSHHADEARTSEKQAPGHTTAGYHCWMGPSGTRYAAPGSRPTTCGVLSDLSDLSDVPQPVRQWLLSEEEQTGGS